MLGRMLDGRYRIEDRIARGGMATVYTATDTRLDRVVALKIMHEGLGSDEDFADRFVHEARAAARLNHPHVVAVFDQGEDDGTVYLVMEYVPGHTLRDVIRAEAPMPPRRALGVLDQILTALAAAHEAGLVHRDVKPENVLIMPTGQVKVADFGLARAVTSATAATATAGVLIGTVSYVAPELVLHQGADARTDVYACGVLLYEMLTGRKPHEATPRSRWPTSTCTRTSRHRRHCARGCRRTSTPWCPGRRRATATSAPGRPGHASARAAGGRGARPGTSRRRAADA
jgi:serine/threonine-protein kinase